MAKARTKTSFFCQQCGTESLEMGRKMSRLWRMEYDGGGIKAHKGRTAPWLCSK